ncbi:MAG TPA: T9SS type A sorting domain-containing protein, partial [Candidatus Cloacimonadota bacterium]|nr:T9SS type A sorting domain-containing protein [Candidatus Cloacimonadota bacterium]
CSIFSNTSARGQDIYVNDARTNINVNLDTFTIQNQSTYYAAYYNYPLYNYHLSIQYLHTVFQEINHDMYVSPNGDDANDGLTPETALRSINKAIYRTAQDSLNPKTVHLLEGNYSPTLNQQSFPIAMKSWVNLVGSGENSTNIHVESDPIMQVTNVSAIWFFMNTHCTISDFRITYATNIQSDVIFGLQEQYLVIRNIKIHELNLINHTLIIMQELTNSLIEGLDISDNTFSDGGILNLSGLSNGTIQNCKFTNCTSTGYSASVWMDPLIWITPNGDIQFENCVFDNLTMTDNDSQCISIGNSYLTDTIILEIRNCQFTNITGNPNSIYIAGTGNPNILIINSTFAGCTASNYALVTYGNVNITNSIFYNNIPYQFYIYPLTSGEHTSLTIDYSCIKNGLSSIANPGTGNQIHYQSTNITYDPAFLGGEENDPLRYSLSNISRCIDRGTPDTTGLALPIADLAGNYRIWNNRIDMGCYEFGSEPVDNDDDVQDPEVSSTLTNYPNPFNPSTIISYTTKQSGDVAIGIYNIRGQFVRNLVHEKQGAGNHMVEWDGKDTSGKQCGSGVYFCKLKTGNQLVTRKMALVK